MGQEFVGLGSPIVSLSWQTSTCIAYTGHACKFSARAEHAGIHGGYVSTCCCKPNCVGITDTQYVRILMQLDDHNSCIHKTSF